jgi:hypothetical protein
MQNARNSWVVEKIISGGQTGADRAALDWAIAPLFTPIKPNSLDLTGVSLQDSGSLSGLHIPNAVAAASKSNKSTATMGL